MCGTVTAVRKKYLIELLVKEAALCRIKKTLILYTAFKKQTCTYEHVQLAPSCWNSACNGAASFLVHAHVFAMCEHVCKVL